MTKPVYPTSEPYSGQDARYTALRYGFIGLEGQDYEKARIVVLPIPFEATTSYMPGARFGPQAIINASRYLELYDIELKKDISSVGIFTLPELACSKDCSGQVYLQIKQAVKQILDHKKFMIMLGGEHSITAGAVAAFKEKYKDLSVLQIDAHTDLRDEYEGTKYHHACAMRRVMDLGIPITAVGIRSQDQAEAEYIKKEKIKTIFYAPEIPIKKIISSLSKNIYLSFDVDGLDPSIMPSTGTPEPGGLGWYETLALLKAVAKEKNIIGADLVELAPIPGLVFPDFLVAKLAYKIIGYSLG